MGNCEKQCGFDKENPQFEILKENMFKSKTNSNSQILASNQKEKSSLNKFIQMVEFPNGEIYEGEYSPKRKRNGKGSYTYQDGSKYTGQYINNKAHGFGRLEHVSGEYYEGNWANDQAEGYGEYKNTDGTIYKGQWKKDLQHGIGSEFWLNGNTFEGDFRMGEKNGKGILKLRDGSVYEVF